jgi:Polyphosphate kinase 2 (PPK2)
MSGAGITFSGSGESFRNTARSSFSTAPGMGGSWWSAWKAWPRHVNGGEVTKRSINSNVCSSRRYPDSQNLPAHLGGEANLPVQDRLINPLKRWKLSYEDFRNRERWADYEVAIEDMMERTSTKRAPWYLVPANDKPFGRLPHLQFSLPGATTARSENRGASGAAIRLAVTMDHAIPIKTVVDPRVARAANYASKRSGWNAPDRLQQKRLLLLLKGG